MLLNRKRRRAQARSNRKKAASDAGKGTFLVSRILYPEALDDRVFGIAAAALFTYAWRGEPTASGQKRACFVCGEVFTRARLPAAFLGFEGDFAPSAAADGALGMGGLCEDCARRPSRTPSTVTSALRPPSFRRRRARMSAGHRMEPT